MSLRPLRYAVAGLSAATLATGLAFVGPADAAAPTPQAGAVTWLTNQLDANGLVAGDVSTTIDFGTALAAAGGSSTTLATIKAGVDANLSTYVVASDTDGSYGVTAAQAALFYQAIGGEQSTVDGLISDVEAATDDSGTDTGLTHAFGGYEGGWSQGLAVRALQAAGSSEAGAATDYLIGMACSGGGWGDTTCSYGADPDDTADALFALIPLAGKGFTAVDDAVNAGVAWLKTNQAADGGFDPGWGENASSTGLAAQALLQAGATTEAKKAAVWLRARQIAGSACDGKLSGDAGAVAYADDRIASGQTDGIAADPSAKYDWYATTVQSFPALAALSAATPSLSGAAWVKAGSSASYKANGLASGQRGCLSVAGKNLALLGGTTTSGSVKFPAGTKAWTATLKVLGGSVTKKVVALAPKQLAVSRTRARVARGGTERVGVSGLFAGESVTVRYAGKVVGHGHANAKGRFSAAFKVGRVKGAKSVKVAGQFSTRHGAASFWVR